MMEEERKEIEIPNIDQSERIRKIREKERKNDLREQRIARDNRRKAVRRTRNKKRIRIIVLIAGVVTIVSAGTYYVGKQISDANKFNNDPVGVSAYNIGLDIDYSEKLENDVIERYDEKYAELIQEIQLNEQSSNDELSQIADRTQEKVDAVISKLADKMLEDFGSLSSKEISGYCSKRTEDKQYYYYDFSSYHKKSVVSNWLKKYFNITQIDNVYNNLSEEEINALIAFTTYGRIENWEGGKNNKEDFLKNFGFTSDKSDKEKLEDAKKIAKDVSFRVAKDRLEPEARQSLDIEPESVGRRK